MVGFGVYVPKVGVFISILSVVGIQVWYVLIAMALLHLNKGRYSLRFNQEFQ
jgi:hypothetical protein